MNFWQTLLANAMPLILGGSGITALIVKEVIKSRAANNERLDKLINGMADLNANMRVTERRIENLENSYSCIKDDVKGLQEDRRNIDRKIDNLSRESREGDDRILYAVRGQV